MRGRTKELSPGLLPLIICRVSIFGSMLDVHVFLLFCISGIQINDLHSERSQVFIGIVFLVESCLGLGQAASKSLSMSCAQLRKQP